MAKKKPKKRNAPPLGASGRLNGDVSFHDFNSFGMKDLPKNGAPKKEFDDDDWRRLQEYANAQCNQREIAAFFGVNIDTLAARIKERYDLSFSEYLSINGEGGKAALRRRLLEIAFSKQPGNVSAAIWLSKNLLGMKDNLKVEGGDNPFKFAYSLMDDELNKQDE